MRAELLRLKALAAGVGDALGDANPELRAFSLLMEAAVSRAEAVCAEVLP